MCGICGVIQVDGRPRPVVDADALAVLTDTMRHRGPDDRGTFCDDGIAFGARRLSVMDPELGEQPVHSEQGNVCAVLNGEIYNQDALRARLRRAGHELRTHCDTEVLPHLYEEHGLDFTDHLVGMFALAVWDARRRRAIVARDHVGVKPLYWTQQGDVVVFASELKSLVSFGVPTVLDEDAIEAYLSLGFVPGPQTPFRGIQKLEPGHRLVVEDGSVRVERWWTFPLPAPDSPPRDRSVYRAELLQLLTESVEMQLEADVPVGAMLSGGLDSSLVVALASRASRKPLKTFAVGLPQANELADARRVAELFGTEHHELELSAEDIEPTLSALAWHLDEPLADLSSVGFYALSRVASEHVTVALSGQGADELFGGYRKHVAAALTGAVPATLRPVARFLAPRLPESLRRPLATIGARDPGERLIAMSGLSASPLLDGLGVEDHARAAARRVASGLSDDPLPAALYLDARLGLVDDMLHYFDRASMAHSLEVRVPFLDHRLVEFSSTLPSGLRVSGRTTKMILKDAARGLLPDAVIDKRKVGFFNGSVEQWLTGQSGTLVGDALTGAAPAYASLLDPRSVREAFADHLSGKDRTQGRALFTIGMLELWMQAFSGTHQQASRERVLVRA
jgi:asparagine synthase (glutamine-hydrolysing)